MSSDLTDRLRWNADGPDSEWTEAAERIDELETLLSTRGVFPHVVRLEDYQRQADRIDDLEAGLRTIVREMDRRQDIASKTVGSNVPGDPLAAIAREALDE